MAADRPVRAPLPRRETTRPEPTVVVVTPVYRSILDRDEEISLHHLENVLGRYDRVFVAPAGLGPKRPGFEVLELAPRHFDDVDSYSRLLLSAGFYQRFATYDFILVYQLDCLVFRDELGDWCRAGYDYLGAPWPRSRDAPELGLSRTGNGGFSLRRVAACLDVLRSERYAAYRPPLLRELFTTRLPDLDSWPPWRRPAKKLKVLREARRGVGWYTSHYSLNEDHFWADRAHVFHPAFRVAPVDVALRFAFDFAPRLCFDLSRKLPFGCHAWSRWDRAFWEPYLLWKPGISGS